MGLTLATAPRAAEAIRRCRLLATCSEETGVTTRTFLSAPMRQVHAHVTEWMQAAGMTVSVDAAGNLRGVYDGSGPAAPRLIIGSHLDTVPHAGAFDGVLGVMMGVGLVEALDGRRLPFAIEVVGFSEEEGVRFGFPFIGSQAFAGLLDERALGRHDAAGHSVADAIRAFGLDPARIPDAAAKANAIGYLEFHIEQGPTLDGLRLPLGIVDAIAGQSRLTLTFSGVPNHAGATPMNARHDALAGAAEWIFGVERIARETTGLVATVGRIETSPNASNVITGTCTVSLDVRHSGNTMRSGAVTTLLELARSIAAHRRLQLSHEIRLDQPATPMDATLKGLLERAVAQAGVPVHHLSSGAGHDAMIVARRMPVAMLFLRSPGGISHHPNEAVHESDVAAALAAGLRFLDLLAAERR